MQNERAIYISFATTKKDCWILNEEIVDFKIIAIEAKALIDAAVLITFVSKELKFLIKH